MRTADLHRLINLRNQIDLIKFLISFGTNLLGDSGFLRFRSWFAIYGVVEISSRGLQVYSGKTIFLEGDFNLVTKRQIYN